MCNQWIAVGKQLPPVTKLACSEFVLCVCNQINGPDQEIEKRAYDFHRAGWIDNDGDLEWRKVTHWQPLPTPPQSEA